MRDIPPQAVAHEMELLAGVPVGEYYREWEA
jgi:hypothetical protein